MTANLTLPPRKGIVSEAKKKLVVCQGADNRAAFEGGSMVNGMVRHALPSLSSLRAQVAFYRQLCPCNEDVSDPLQLGQLPASPVIVAARFSLLY